MTLSDLYFAFRGKRNLQQKPAGVFGIGLRWHNWQQFSKGGLISESFSKNVPKTPNTINLKEDQKLCCSLLFFLKWAWTNCYNLLDPLFLKHWDFLLKWTYVGYMWTMMHLCKNSEFGRDSNRMVVTMFWV